MGERSSRCARGARYVVESEARGEEDSQLRNREIFKHSADSPPTRRRLSFRHPLTSAIPYRVAPTDWYDV